MAPDADHPIRTLARTLWGDLCLDAVSYEGSRLIPPKGDDVDEGCAFQTSRSRMCISNLALPDVHNIFFSLEQSDEMKKKKYYLQYKLGF